MAFNTDEQTIKDLSLKRTWSESSVMGLFQPVTIGGMEKLEQIFKSPFADLPSITKRSNAINYLQQLPKKLKLDKDDLDFIEYYLNHHRAKKASKFRAYKDALKYRIASNNTYYILSRGVMLTTKVLYEVKSFLEQISPEQSPELLTQYLTEIEALLTHQPITPVERLTAWQTEQWDQLFRSDAYVQVKKVLDIIYELDVFIAVGLTAKKMQFSYPDMIPDDTAVMEITGLFHPIVNNPVPNDISFNQANNLCFLTGANMAGKSTLLKSIGIAVYLAHLGFPVPATSMRSSVFKGLFTTINLNDNLNVGHSHFYAEVLRVKQIAGYLSELKQMVVIFDELFRGTNVKDAYDASVAIIRALANVKGSIFLISTHILEVAPQLNDLQNISFKCLATTLKGEEAVYDYKLKDGVSEERLGMRIIQQEGIIDLINKQASN